MADWSKHLNKPASRPSNPVPSAKPVLSVLDAWRKEQEKEIALNDWRKPYATAQLAVSNAPGLKDWTVKKFHQRKAHDGVAFSCDLYYKGAKVGSAEQDGWGGPDRVQISGAEAEKSWNELCKVCSDNGWGSVEAFAGVLEVVLIANGK